MGLHDRIKSTNGNGNGNGSGHEPHAALAAVHHHGPDETPTLDPYADLKTRIHHACIAKLGPQLFASEATGDLTDNDDLQREGKADQAGASIKEKVNKVADAVKDKVDDLKK